MNTPNETFKRIMLPPTNEYLNELRDKQNRASATGNELLARYYDHLMKALTSPSEIG